jgi:hypothetical protein
MSKKALSIAAMHEDHEACGREHASWLADNERWHVEHRVALESRKPDISPLFFRVCGNSWRG